MPEPAAAEPHAAPELPPLPPLDRSVYRVHTVPGADGRVQSAFVPATESHICRDPQAPHVVFIPGMGLDAAYGVRQFPLGARAHVHSVNVPNEPFPGETHLAAFAAHVEEYILTQQLDRAPGGLILGGNSMGGAISLLIALRGRVKLRQLLLLGTFGHSKHLPWHQRAAAPLAYVIPMAFGHYAACTAAGWFALHGRTRAEWNWIARPNIWRTHGYYGRACAALTTLRLTEQAHTLNVPTLVLHGRRDRILRFPAAEELARTIPGAQLIPFDNAGHNVTFTHAPAVNQAIQRFCEL